MIEKLENLLRPKGSPGLCGLWLDEHDFVQAAAALRQSGVHEFEAISPFPVHGIDEAIGLKRSWIPYACFVFAILGCAFGVWFTWWTSAVDWPLIIGGKPMWSLPAFIPIIFECTILFAALGSVGTMLMVNCLPQVDPPVLDKDLTSHKFALFVPDSAGRSQSELQKLFNDNKAVEVKRGEF